MFSVLAVGAGLALFSVYRMYMNKYSFTVGLDYFEPEFQVYWMRLFWIQMTLIGLVGAIGIPWLWITRERDPDAVSP